MNPNSLQSGSETVFELYHEVSKLNADDSETYARIGMFNSSPELRRLVSSARSSWHRGIVELPRIDDSLSSLEQILRSRRSHYDFRAFPLTLQEFSHLLWAADGRAATMHESDGIEWPRRNAPSGGGLFPIQIYAICNNVEGVAPGLYSYDTTGHCLALCFEEELGPRLESILAVGEVASKAAVCLILTGVFGRSAVKYGERAYRFCLLEAGHIAQNTLLLAAESHLANLVVGGFFDDDLNSLLRVDGVAEAALYCILLGHGSTVLNK